MSKVVKFGPCLRDFACLFSRPEGVILYHRNTFINQKHHRHFQNQEHVEWNKLCILQWVVICLIIVDGFLIISSGQK